MTFQFSDFSSTPDGRKVIVSEQDPQGIQHERLLSFRFVPVPRTELRTFEMPSPMTLMQLTKIIHGEVGPWSLVAFFNELPQPWAQWMFKTISARTIYYMDVAKYQAIVSKQRHP